MADAHDFICALDGGYDATVGENGVGLSGGQRQRIAIARALYASPRILVFDEATSALDTLSEHVIRENLKAVMANRTTVIVAHRLNTVRNADRIVVLDGGEIVEQGTHDQLLQRGRLYAKLVREQLS